MVVPWGEGLHEVEAGSKLEFKGSLELDSSKVPQGNFFPYLTFVAFPKSTPFPEDPVVRAQREWRVIGEGGTLHNMKMEDDLQVDPKAFPPGEYEVRIFLTIRDFEGTRQDAQEWLGTTFLRVTESATLPN